MKTLALLLTLGLLAGCGQIDQLYERQNVYTTNWVTYTFLSTNNASGEVELVTQPRAVVTERLVLAPRASVEAGLGVAKSVIPIPYADAAAAALLLAYGIYASVRNRRNEAASNRIVGTLVDNIDKAKKLIQSVGSPVIKEKFVEEIKDDQEIRNVRDAIKPFVT